MKLIVSVSFSAVVGLCASACTSTSGDEGEGEGEQFDIPGMCQSMCRNNGFADATLATEADDNEMHCLCLNTDNVDPAPEIADDDCTSTCQELGNDGGTVHSSNSTEPDRRDACECASD